MGKNLINKKISFMGAMCSGKTTLFNTYKDYYKNKPEVLFIPEAGRTFLETHHALDRTLTTTQAAIQLLALQNEQNATFQKPELIICDNSILSAAAHVIVFGDTKGADKLLQEVAFWLPTYSMFFLLDVTDISYINDAIRTEDILFRNNLQKVYLQLLKKTTVPYTIIKGTVEERMKIVNNYLDNLTNA